MINDYSIVILNKYPDVIEPFLKSIRRHTHGADMPQIAIIGDDHNRKYQLGETVRAEPPFVFSKSVNLGFDQFPQNDILLCNDDIEIIQDNFLETLHLTAASFSRAGIVAPLVKGGVGSPWADFYKANSVWPQEAKFLALQDSVVPFICVYITRKCINEIGPMDEEYIHYGRDDDDYCIRARKADFQTLIVRDLVIKHGDGKPELRQGENWNKTYQRAGNTLNNEIIHRRKHSSRQIS